MRKVLLTWIVIAALVLGGIIAYGVVNLGPIVKEAVEFAGPRLIGAPVRLDEARISLMDGEGELHGLFVGNPEGFQSPSALEADVVALAVDRSSFASDVVVIRSLTLRGPRLTYERSGRTSNLDALLANARRASGRESAARQGRAEDGGEPGGAQKIIIDDLTVSGATLALAVSGMEGSLATVPLPEVHLTGIGRAEGGVPPSEAVRAVLEALTRSAADAVGAGASSAGEGLSRGLGAVRGAIEKGFKNLLGK